MSNLLSRGNTHRDVLEDYYNTSTINHVGIMESESDFVVVITDTEGNTIVHSNSIESEMQNVIQKAINNPIDHDGRVVSNDWRHDDYIASQSVIFTENEIKGHVFMFAETEQIRNLLG
ncbi:hypothetical protein [Alkalibacillus filiformis]|nr:hypothetical protein [Alkalibacillus filiformis]